MIKYKVEWQPSPGHTGNKPKQKCQTFLFEYPKSQEEIYILYIVHIDMKWDVLGDFGYSLIPLMINSDWCSVIFNIIYFYCPDHFKPMRGRHTN